MQVVCASKLYLIGVMNSIQCKDISTLRNHCADVMDLFDDVGKLFQKCLFADEF